VTSIVENKTKYGQRTIYYKLEPGYEELKETSRQLLTLARLVLHRIPLDLSNINMQCCQQTPHWRVMPSMSIFHAE